MRVSEPTLAVFASIDRNIMSMGIRRKSSDRLDRAAKRATSSQTAAALGLILKSLVHSGPTSAVPTDPGVRQLPWTAQRPNLPRTPNARASLGPPQRRRHRWALRPRSHPHCHRPLGAPRCIARKQVRRVQKNTTKSEEVKLTNHVASEIGHLHPGVLRPSVVQLQWRPNRHLLEGHAHYTEQARHHLCSSNTSPGATCSAADEELIELLISGCATGVHEPFFKGRSVASTPAQPGPPTPPTPMACRGTALISPWASNYTGMWVRFFFPASGSRRSAKRTAGSTYAQFRRASRTTSPRFVCSSPV